MIELARVLRSETARAVVRLRGLTEAQAVRSRGQGKWVKKEILGHLIDSAANNHQRFVWAQFNDPFAWPEYEQERWVQIHRYRDRPWLELVDLWAALNAHVAAVVEGMPEGKLQTQCRIGDLEPTSLEGLMQGYMQHMRHHLDQLGGE